MISDDYVEKALDYLRDSAQEYAQSRSAEKFYEGKLKRLEAIHFMEQTSGAVEAKRMAARASEEYGQCLEDYKESKYNAELLSAYREAAKMKVSWAQTERKASIGAY
jgi:hypothetical protein